MSCRLSTATSRSQARQADCRAASSASIPAEAAGLRTAAGSFARWGAPPDPRLAATLTGGSTPDVMISGAGVRLTVPIRLGDASSPGH